MIEEKIKDQKSLIQESDWKYLIILDACRYDYFEDIYSKFFEGNLEKIRSVGSRTKEWVKIPLTNVS